MRIVYVYPPGQAAWRIQSVRFLRADLAKNPPGRVGHRRRAVESGDRPHHQSGKRLVGGHSIRSQQAQRERHRWGGDSG